MIDKNYICPVCRTKYKEISALSQSGNSVICGKNHCFDMAKEGYFNFDMNNHATDSGDSKEMCQCRREFLSGGFYDAFAKKLSEIAFGLCEDNPLPHIADAGCGEGYYMRFLQEFFNNHNKQVIITGADLAKNAIKLASKGEKQKTNEKEKISFCVASIFELPLHSESQDIVFSIFAPVGDSEAKRILKKGGYLIVAGAGKDHLYRLKEAIYDKPYKNQEKTAEYDGFDLLKTHNLKYSFCAENKQLKNLFAMTPYFWKTSQSDAEKIDLLSRLEITADFFLHVYKKI